ncbi:MAG: DNA topoisomerase 3 [Myxococcota bacterium]|nr:DNA topoisomerase 3 [Myxococcota bacterium]
MAKSLVITEKPSVARDIAAVLGGFTDHDGYMENDDYVVTFAVGHLFELLPPEEVDPKYKAWTLANLPILPESFDLRPKQGQSERIRTIKKLLARDDVDEVINACDAGREGELIFREIVEHLDSDKPVKRLWLQSMTDGAIREGFGSLRPGTELEGLAAAAHCRARSDWMIGMNATRALTKRLKSRKEKTAWSAGRVQTPTLALLVARELEVLAHVPRPFWRVSAVFEHAGQEYTGSWFDPAFEAGGDEHAREDRLFDETRANEIVQRVSGQAGNARETRKPSRESAPPLFDLTSLQREANRRFSWSARRALSAAQRCYERHKILTYPRTDSRCLPNDYRETVNEVLATFAASSGHPEEGFAQHARNAAHLQQAGLQNEKRIFDDSGVSDHFAIIPTGTLPSEPLQGDDKRLYDLVVRRFLGAFFPPAVWERVDRVTVAAGESFRTRARHLKEEGWRAVLPPGSDEERDAELRPLVEGSAEADGVGVRNLRVESEADETKPPPRITEARLLSLMENAGKQVEDEDHAAALHEKGIGTPATRADVIENLIAKGYAVRADKSLKPTVKGIRLIDILNRIDAQRLTSPALTGEIEFHLNQVEKGERDADDFMAEITDYAVEIVEIAKTFEYHELYEKEQPLGPCPACQRPVVEMVWFYRCEEQPDVEKEDDCPLRFWKDTSGRYMDRQSVRTLIQDGKTGPLEGFTARSGRTYKGFLELDREAWQVKVRSLGYDEGQISDQPEYDVNPEPLGACPFEETCHVVESPVQYICERALKQDDEARAEDAPKTCGFVFPRTVCKREITRDEAETYLKTGKTGLLTEFTSRFGRPFAATLVLKENGRHGFEFQPREGRGGAAKEEGGAGKKQAATRKKTTTRKKKAGTRKKTATKKKTGTRKKSAAKTSARKKQPATKKKAAVGTGTGKTTRKKATRAGKSTANEPGQA